MKTTIGRLRVIGLLEGTSFLILLGIAMPLKYMFGLPFAVKLVGWAHGLLFVLFCVALAQAAVSARWSVLRAASVFVAALLPFGPFLIDGRLKREELALRPPSVRSRA
jgi:integral membrane protein